MAEKVRKYTKAILVRLSEDIHTVLKEKCKDKQINEAVYARKAIELCLKKDLINGGGY
jgi:hypothetical protein